MPNPLPPDALDQHQNPIRRLGIVSDTHDQVARTSRAVAALAQAGADVLIHLGDLCGPDVVYACAGLPACFIWGNNEEDLTSLRQAIAAIGGTCLEWGGPLNLAGRRIALTHGDRPREYRRLLETGPDYLLSGHTHLRHDHRQGPTRCINPGALHRAARYSVALLDLTSDDLHWLEVR
ncbi:MAG: phosphodiesterase [Isosphaeraceae bacterium]|jgi:putative phosphoesterase|nr:MAG: phosphodiesterase [Isosphaeraceae bacterium]